jgi:hypothetical protein
MTLHALVSRPSHSGRVGTDVVFTGISDEDVAEVAGPLADAKER